MNIDLRDWQRRAIDKFRKEWFAGKRQWLFSVTPGGGKTLCALFIAKWLLDEGLIDRVVIVVPTGHILDQWINHDDHGKKPLLIHLTSEKNTNGAMEDSRDFQGCVITYQQLASGSGAKHQRVACGMGRTLIISDEIHHCGTNQSWGKAHRDAFEGACIAHIGLTGTPWRQASMGRISFVEYDSNGDVIIDFPYAYETAVTDNVCRKALFLGFDSEISHKDLDSCVPGMISEMLSDSDEDNSDLLKYVLSPWNPWLPSILRLADAELLAIRNDPDESERVRDAKGLVIARKRIYAIEIQKILQRITGEPVALIISDGDKAETEEDVRVNAKEELELFRKGKKGRWAVSVDMFSEGVDEQSLFVLVYATNKITKLRWRQSTARVLRKRHADERDAIIFFPAIPTLLELASSMREEMRHSTDKIREEAEDEEDEKEGPQKREKPCHKEEDQWDAIEVSEAEHHSAIDWDEVYTAQAYQMGVATCQRLKIPTRFAAQILQLQQELNPQSFTQILSKPLTQKQPPAPPEKKTFNKDRYKKELKKEVNSLVKQIAYTRCSATGDISQERVRQEILALSDDLIQRYDKRDKMTIEQLKEARTYLEGLKERESEEDRWT